MGTGKGAMVESFGEVTEYHKRKTYYIEKS